MAGKELFRSEVIRARSGRLEGELQLSQPVSVRVVSGGGAVVLALLALLLVFGSLSRKVTVSGEVRPSLGLLTIAAPRSGVIQTVHAEEGARVLAGQPLMMIVNAHSTLDRDTAKALLELVVAKRNAVDQEYATHRRKGDAEREHLSAEILYLSQEREQVVLKADIEVRTLEVLDELGERYRKLEDKRHVSRLQMQQHEMQVLAAEGRHRDVLRTLLEIRHRLDSAARKLTAVDDEIELSASRHASAIAQLEQDAVEIGASANWLVTAPVEGMVTTQLSNVGQMVTAGEPLLHIVPEGGRLEARLKIPTRAVGFIGSGSSVRLRVDAFPYQSYGHLEGTVTSVSKSAISTSAGQPPGGDSYYLATVLIDAGSANGMMPLRVGMRLEADLYQESRKLYQWVLHPLTGPARNLEN